MHGINTSVPHFFSRVRGTRIVVTLEIVSKVLHFPRVAHPDYPGYERLRIVSKDELSSRFCGTPFSWGNHQNTLYSGFAKGLRFLDMVMTFVLHPLSHYNSITEPRARFLLSLLEDISIEFPSHFILSLIDIYRDMATRDKLIFPSVIAWILHHFSVPFPVISYTLLLPFVGVRHSLDWGGPKHRWQLLQLLLLHPPLLLHLMQVEWHLRPLWHSLWAWMLALTFSVMSCVRWTPVSIISYDDKLPWVVSLLLFLLLHWRSRMRVTMAPVVRILMRMMVLAHLVMMRCLLDVLALCHLWQKGRVVLR